MLVSQQATFHLVAAVGRGRAPGVLHASFHIMPTSEAAAASNPLLLFQRQCFDSPLARLRPRARSDWRACSSPRPSLVADGPSCLFVGPIETASQEMLEALYRQVLHVTNLLYIPASQYTAARNAYYSGNPLIVDDMFDKVELKLRLYGSKSVVKYPRCSLRRQSTYADAEEDPSQALTLASVWILLLAFGTCAILVPTIHAIDLAFTDKMNPTQSMDIGRHPLDLLMMANRILFVVLGYLVGYPIALASVQALRRLWMHDLVALKGSCPNCSEEVFAFVTTDKSYWLRHRAECHVCESLLEFRTKVENQVLYAAMHNETWQTLGLWSGLSSSTKLQEESDVEYESVQQA